MGFGVTELLILLVIVALLFGTKKLRNIGDDLGGAVKSFKSAVSNEDKDTIDKPDSNSTENSVIEGELENNHNESSK